MDEKTPAFDVVVAGAGPTGLMLAGELAMAGVRCRVVERRQDRTRESRALGLHGRTMEVLNMRGMAEEVLARANPIPQVRVSLGSSLFDMGRLATDYGQLTIIPQGETEEILEKRATELGVVVDRGVALTDCRQSGRSVVCTLEQDGRVWEETASWLVGCDGSRSRVREAMGADFTGATYPYTIIVADVKLGVPLDDQLLIRVGRAGLVVATDFGNGWYRMGVIDRDKPWSDEPVTLAEVDQTLAKLFGRDMRPSEPLWTSRFHIQERQASSYRQGRMLIAGDAAHVHSPLGGQGLNLGIQDAVNLGWKLAAVVGGRAGDDLLDTFELERRRVSQGVIKVTDIATRMMTSDQLPARIARKTVMSVASRVPVTHRLAVGHLSGIATSYPTMAAAVGASSLVGNRVPDLTIAGGGRPRRLHEEMRKGGFVLIDRTDGAPLLPSVPEGDPGLLRIGGRIVADSGPWRKPEVVLIRPDGYCAWAGSREHARGQLSNTYLRWIQG
ncbi:FAD-dependent monooxygenase [Streptomyces sp. NPDC003832]